MEYLIKTILFEDNKAFQDSMQMYFDDSETVHLAAIYPSADKALIIIKQQKPDVVLMDIQMPGISGIEAIMNILASEPDTKILVQTSFEDDHKIFAALCAGAKGYILKSSDLDQTEQAIMDVMNGGGYFSPSIASKVIAFFKHQAVTHQPNYVELTPTEKEVLQCMAEGMSYKMIEDKLEKSFSAVHFHIKNIYKKLHVNSMTEAVIKALKNHLI